MKRVASLNVDEVKGGPKRFFIFKYKAFSQLVGESQELFLVKKNDYVGINFQIKYDVAVNSFRKEKVESV